MAWTAEPNSKESEYPDLNPCSYFSYEPPSSGFINPNLELDI